MLVGGWWVELNLKHAGMSYCSPNLILRSQDSVSWKSVLRFPRPSGHFSVPLPVPRLPVLIEIWKVLLTVIGMPSGLCGGWSSLCWLASRFILGRGLARRFIFVSGLASRFEFGGWLPRWFTYEMVLM